MKNFSGGCQAAGADKPLRAFFIWITNIVTLSVSPRIILIESNNPQSIAAVGISFKWIKTDSVLHSWQCHQRTLPQKVSHTF